MKLYVSWVTRASQEKVKCSQDKKKKMKDGPVCWAAVISRAVRTESPRVQNLLNCLCWCSGNQNVWVRI